MISISFCIASAKNEKEYTKLLLKSLYENTTIANHEILIFIDSDNQNTYEELLEEKKQHNNIRIYKNKDPEHMVGSQRNVSLMFNAASHDTICYLQSDMVVGKNFDNYLSETINKYPESIISCARIEPPLHPPSADKVIYDCGLTPEEFNYDRFNQVVNKIQLQNLPDGENYFAPFATTKKIWFDILGGFDTQFRCSREDSDIHLRCNIAKIKLVQSWKAIVYHFTCVSSRGKDWFRPDKKAMQKNILQQYADNEELRRFTRKWGKFGHEPKPIYDIGMYLNIDQFVDFHLLEWLEIHCKTLYINNKDVYDELSRRVKFNAEYYSNLRWKYSTEHWQKVKYLFNQEAIDNHIKLVYQFSNNHDVNIYINYSELIDEFNQNRQQFVDSLNEHIDTYPIGKKEVYPFTFDIIRKIDLSSSYIKVKNTELLLESNKFVFE